MSIADPETYPVELEAPDIARYRAGNTGVEWVTTFDSGRSGPHVMVSAVVHGNEICGAIALDWLFRHDVRPRQGRLSLAFMNVGAYLAFDPEAPSDSRYLDQDFNRVWQATTLDAEAGSREIERARAVRPIVDTVDLLLDLHSMQHETVGLMLSGPLPKGEALARQVGMPEHIVADRGHAEGTRLRDYGGFGDPASPKNALLHEAGQHWVADSGPRSIEAAIRFLHAVGTVDPDYGADFLAGRPAPGPQRAIEVLEAVTVESEDFAFTAPFRGLEEIARAGTVIARDGGREIATPFDKCVLIMPSRRLQIGKTAVRLGRFT